MRLGIFDNLINVFLNKLYSIYKSAIKNIVYSIKISWESSRWAFTLRVLFQLFFAGIAIANMYISKMLIDFLTYNQTMQKNELILNNFLIILLVMFTFNIIFVALLKINDIITDLFNDKLTNIINLKLINKTTNLDISFFDSVEFHNEFKNVKKDQDALQNLSFVVFGMIKQISQIVPSIILLSSLSVNLTLCMIILAIPSVFAERFFSLKMYYWSRSKALDERKMVYYQSILTERAYAKDLRLFSLFDVIIEKYTSYWKKWLSEKTRLNIRKAIFTAIISILPYFASFALLYYLGIKILNKTMTVGDYSLYSGLAAMVTSSVSSIISSFINILDSNIKIVNFNKFLSIEPRVLSSGNLLPSGNLDIEFKNVSFKYPNTDDYILKDVSFFIKHGEKIALVGMNGAGKTTINNLLLRFYDVTGGQILLGGIDIKEYDVSSYRKYYSAVFQDFVNYSFTARMNIALSQIENIDDDAAILQACKITGADKLISKWEKGLDSYLTKQFDKDGEELSLGEWQKIAITRAYFRKSKAIILDEPSASLDVGSEYEIFKSFSEISKDKTVIFVSHRLSNVTIADRILLLENGYIIEEGSVKELIKKNGKFAYLFRLQADRYTINEDN